MFVHHAKMKNVRSILSERFRVFIHTTILFQRKNKQVKKYERPTISGLVFVQGDSKAIQAYLRDELPGLHLVNDCSTGRVAVIPDEVMQPFMLLSHANPTRIRFMPRIYDYYSTGNTLVRITSGPLAGLEGYRVRIARDKCLVTSIGGMTVAIGGVSKENFENLDEYARQRKAESQEAVASARLELSPLQAEIEACLFQPKDALDSMALAAALQPWIARAQHHISVREFALAAEMLLYMLEASGSRLKAALRHLRIEELANMLGCCREAARLLTALPGDLAIEPALKESIETQLDSLSLHYPFLHVGE